MLPYSRNGCRDACAMYAYRNTVYATFGIHEQNMVHFRCWEQRTLPFHHSECSITSFLALAESRTLFPFNSSIAGKTYKNSKQWPSAWKCMRRFYALHISTQQFCRSFAFHIVESAACTDAKTMRRTYIQLFFLSHVFELVTKNKRRTLVCGALRVCSVSSFLIEPTIVAYNFFLARAFTSLNNQYLLLYYSWHAFYFPFIMPD